MKDRDCQNEQLHFLILAASDYPVLGQVHFLSFSQVVSPTTIWIMMSFEGAFFVW